MSGGGHERFEKNIGIMALAIAAVISIIPRTPTTPGRGASAAITRPSAGKWLGWKNWGWSAGVPARQTKVCARPSSRPAGRQRQTRSTQPGKRWP